MTMENNEPVSSIGSQTNTDQTGPHGHEFTIFGCPQVAQSAV